MSNNCIGCNGDNHAFLDQTWTKQSSLKEGVWVPFSSDSSWTPTSTERFCTSCGPTPSGDRSSAVFEWTRAGNVTPRDSLWKSIVVNDVQARYPQSKERFYGTGSLNDIGSNGIDYSTLTKTWSKKGLYQA